MSVHNNSLILSERSSLLQRLGSFSLKAFLFMVTSFSTFAVLFIIFFIAKDAVPFFRLEGFREFFSGTNWYPSAEPGEFGAFSIFLGTGLVTLGSIIVAVPLGISASVCLSDVLPFKIRQVVKPVIEILAAIPSVAYGFFALVVFAPMLQDHGGKVLYYSFWVIGFPVLTLLSIIVSDLVNDRINKRNNKIVQGIVYFVFFAVFIFALSQTADRLLMIKISSGANALNVSIILGIMALPTVVSVSEDALQAAGRDIREGSYALGATRAETILKVVLPAARSGILAAVILGMMRAVGETMVVWMASGNAAQIPDPWYNFLEPVRTLTATIAGDMGEADHVTGSSRYHVLFAMALSLLVISFLSNFFSEWIVVRSRKKLKGL